MMNLNTMLDNGIQNIAGTLARYYIKNRKGRAFLAHMLPQIQTSAGIRRSHEEQGTHVPPFLIASIASQCNLYCAGCYARAGGGCGGAAAADLNAGEWRAILDEAAQLGVSFVLLAGGEPFLRRDVIEAAAQMKQMIFPVFTNGTMMDDRYLSLLDDNRNVVPVLSLEGAEAQTDLRRGAGTYAQVRESMAQLHRRGILFGASITVTKENMALAASEAFISSLRAQGCGLVFFVEYVPVSAGTEHLVLGEADLEALAQAAKALKRRIKDMIILSFPGDEAAMGGCLASGRGFFHINASGGAEPCPFAPYARHNLKTDSILDVLHSDYFAELRDIAQQAGPHTGGCTLFDRIDQVAAFAAR